METKIALVGIVLSFLVTTPGLADDHVRGYWKDTDRDGIKDTWIDPYYRTEPNRTRQDNYSTRGNINPYTGQRGDKAPDDLPWNYPHPFGHSRR